MRIAVLIVFATCLAARGGEIKERVVPSRSFRLRVRPQTPADHDARTADLYMTRFPANGWVFDGPCEPQPDADGVPQFFRTVSVPEDGIYYFLSRGGDAAGKAEAPTRKDPPQFRIIADTRPPVVQLDAPREHVVLRAGQAARIEWSAMDEHFAARPVTLRFSRDGGRTWEDIAIRQRPAGVYVWTVPETLRRPVLLRAEAEDRAGNVAGDSSRAPLKVMPPADAGFVPPEVDGPIADESEEMEKPDPEPETPDVVPLKDEPKQADGEKDPRPGTRFPELDANSPGLAGKRAGQSNARSAYIAYIMAGNLVRQGRLKDSLRYYRTAVDQDENYDEAWSDMSLVYKQLGAYAKADSCVIRALKIVPRDPEYVHNRGEIYQAHGLSILQDPGSGNEALARAHDAVHFAIKCYGMAIEYATRQGKLAERAATYFRLGELCYFANQDPVGARQYWTKVLELHTPTPNLDNVILDKGTDAETRTRLIYEKHTELKVQLETWQRWARAYLEQLNELERGVAPRPRLTAPTTGESLGRSLRPGSGAAGDYGRFRKRSDLPNPATTPRGPSPKEVGIGEPDPVKPSYPQPRYDESAFEGWHGHRERYADPNYGRFAYADPGRDDVVPPLKKKSFFSRLFDGADDDGVEIVEERANTAGRNDRFAPFE